MQYTKKTGIILRDFALNYFSQFHKNGEVSPRSLGDNMSFSHFKDGNLLASMRPLVKGP